ncbi:MAG: DUF4331 family protein [Dehalococcoidia bacterium]
MKLRKLTVALGGAAMAAVALGSIPAMGADHRDSPATTAAPRSDINDVYLFRGEQASGAVLAMTVNPLTSPADTVGLRLDPDTLYEFKVDTNADAVADIAYKFRFSGTGAVQDVTVHRATGAAAVSNDPGGDLILSGKTSTGSGVTAITDASGRKLYVGPRDDPFFFDLAGFQAGLQFTGVDTFKGTNVTAIVLEVPSLPAQALGIWGTTSKQNNLSQWAQLERMGRPAINTVFIPSAQKDAFNTNSPDRDESIYTDEVTAALNSLMSPATEALAGLLLPDILTADFGMGVGYLNGRDLNDDVIDISLQAITGNTAASDMVPANDKAFSNTFPYMAAPHGAAAPGAPSTGTGTVTESGTDMLRWTLPAGLIAGAFLFGAAGHAQRRRPGVQA